MALIMGSPPAASAGKNFTVSSPSSMAASMSEGQQQPGITGIPFSVHQRTTFGLSPGLTINFAPALCASWACCTVSTVPAPTSRSGWLSAMIRMASFAAFVRKVTSAQGRPPSSSARARLSASAASSSAMTGTMPIFPISSTM